MKKWGLAAPDDNRTAIERLQNNMPSLHHLEPSLRAKRFLRKICLGNQQPTGRGRQIADGFVRLADKMLLEYEASRNLLVLFLSEGNADFLYRAQDHFESCIQSLHKGVLFLERLRSLGLRRSDGSPFVPRPRDFPILRDDAKVKIREIRDAVEHLEERILNGEVPSEAEVGVHLGWEDASVSNHKLAYKEVAKWIESVHALAALLSTMQLVVIASGSR